MPVNLNALIRYKTIDQCLRNTAVLVDIDYLIKHCSDALYDATGKQSGVSERTIRNDIRILRSDILGFNAPIVVKDGVYRYEDSNFSIFESSFSEMELLIDIQELLVEEFHNLNNKNVPLLLEKLSTITKVSIAKEYLPQHKTDTKPGIYEKRVATYNRYAIELHEFLNSQNHKPAFWKSPKPLQLKWQFVFEVVDAK